MDRIAALQKRERPIIYGTGGRMAYVLSPRRFFAVLTILIGVAWSNAAFAVVEYSVTDLGALLGTGRPTNVASAINASGQVVASSSEFIGGAHTYGALLFGNNAVTQLPGLPAPYNFEGQAIAINNNGQIAGEAGTDAYGFDGQDHAILYSGGQVIDLGTLGGSYSSATGINNNGVVVGESNTSALSVSSHAFMYQNGIMTDLGTLGGLNSAANAVNDLGEVVGYSDTSNGSRNAFVYSGGTMMSLGAGDAVE